MNLAPQAAGTGWVAVVPVKVLRHAKTRLQLPDDLRVQLALAFARDVIEAIAASTLVAAVVLVSDEADVRECAVAVLGERVVLVDDGGAGVQAAAGVATRAGGGLDTEDGADRDSRPGAGTDPLNTAIARGVAAAGDRPTIVLTADLATLRGSDLDEVVAEAELAGRALVADASGAGTAMVAAVAPGPLTAFGVGSAARHEAMGYTRLAEAPVRARLDVDSLADLRVAIELGVGRHTSAVLAAHPELVAAG